MEKTTIREKITKRMDRRCGPDRVLRAIRWLGITGWVLVIIIAGLFEISRPVITTFYERWFNAHTIQPEWNLKYAYLLLFFLYLGLTISSLGIWLNLKRLKRKTDFYRIHFFFLLVFMFMGIIYITVQISG